MTNTKDGGGVIRNTARTIGYSIKHPMIATRSTVSAINKGVDSLSKKIRTAPAITFNASKPIVIGGILKVSEMQAFKDFAQIDSITQVMILIMVFLFLIIFWWCLNKMYLDKSNCSALESVYTEFPIIQSVNVENPRACYKIRDFYIKTAYNCCSGGKYKNDFVNICALKNCIRQGARCLDFEIYSVNNRPVIAISSADDYNIKESNKSVPFAKAMEIINLYAFSGSTCPNPSDPLFLNFRIMSNNKNIYDDMAKSLYNILQDRLLGKQFSYENNGVNIGGMQLKKLMSSVIIIVDKSNPLFTDTLLNEYVNIASSTPFMRTLRYKDVQFTPDMDELKFYNKQNMTICLPNLSAGNKNLSARLAMAYGCQMIGMSFQNFDSNMEDYASIFDDAGSAFVLRPKILRYVPVYIDKPPPVEDRLSYAPRMDNPLGAKGPKLLDTQF